jgi:hypothetical protein
LPREAAVAEHLEFERLELTVDMIATHRDYPGKQEVVRECLQEIDERREGGRLTFEQWAKLVAVLLFGQPTPREFAHA